MVLYVRAAEGTLRLLLLPPPCRCAAVSDCGRCPGPSHVEQNHYCGSAIHAMKDAVHLCAVTSGFQKLDGLFIVGYQHGQCWCLFNPLCAARK